MKIYKYPLMWDEVQTIRAPIVRVLTLQLQYGAPTLWAMVDERAQPKEYVIRMYATGEPLPSPQGVYLGTLSLVDFVFHFFDMTDVTATKKEALK